MNRLDRQTLDSMIRELGVEIEGAAKEQFGSVRKASSRWAEALRLTDSTAYAYVRYACRGIVEGIPPHHGRLGPQPSEIHIRRYVALLRSLDYSRDDTRVVFLATHVPTFDAIFDSFGS